MITLEALIPYFRKIVEEVQTEEQLPRWRLARPSTDITEIIVTRTFEIHETAHNPSNIDGIPFPPRLSLTVGHRV